MFGNVFTLRGVRKRLLGMDISLQSSMGIYVKRHLYARGIELHFLVFLFSSQISLTDEWRFISEVCVCRRSASKAVRGKCVLNANAIE